MRAIEKNIVVYKCKLFAKGLVLLHCELATLFLVLYTLQTSLYTSL